MCWGESINYRYGDNNGDKVEQSPLLAVDLLEVTELSSGKARS